MSGLQAEGWEGAWPVIDRRVGKCEQPIGERRSYGRAAVKVGGGECRQQSSETAEEGCHQGDEQTSHTQKAHKT